MNQTLRKNLINNGFASLLQKLVRIFEQLLLVPFFLSAWGPAYYGEWLTLTAVPTVLALSDLGISTAASNTFVLRWVAGNFEGAARTAKIALTVLGAVSIILIVGSAAIVFFMDQGGIFGSGEISREKSIIGLSLLMVARLSGFYVQFADSFFRAARRAAFGMQLMSAQAALKVIASIVILSLKFDIIVLCAADLAISLLFGIGYYRFGVRLLPGLDRQNPKFDWPEFRELVTKGFSYLLSPTWQAIFFQGTTIVVRTTLGPESVALFNTVRTLCRSVNQFYSMVNSTLFPELQFEIGRGNYALARQLFRVGLLITSISAICGTILLYVFGPSLYNIWTGGTLSPPETVWKIFILGILLNAIWWTASMVFRAVNQPTGFAVAGLIAASISVAASWILSDKFGLEGAALGSLLIELILSIYVIYATFKILDQKFYLFPSEIFEDARRLVGMIHKNLMKRLGGKSNYTS